MRPRHAHILLFYYLKRWAWPFLGALFFYTGMILAWEIRNIAKLVFDRGVSSAWLFPFLATVLPETFNMVFPMAAVLGGMMGSQQLCEGSEMVASQGLGMGKRSIVMPWLCLSGLLLAFCLFNAHYLMPKASTLQNQLQARMLEEAKTRFLRPGAPPISTDLVVAEPNAAHALWLAPSGEIHLMEASPKGVQHVVAQGMAWGKQEKDGVITDLSIVLQDLKACGVTRPEDKVHGWKSQSLALHLPIKDHQAVFTSNALRHKHTKELFLNPSPTAKIELALRFSLPVATCALLLLGIALGIGHSRFQKGGAILRSLGVILTYHLLIDVSKTQISNGKQGFMYFILALPWLFLGLAWWLLDRKLKPHRTRRRWLKWPQWMRRKKKNKPAGQPTQVFAATGEAKRYRFAVFRIWAQGLWWRNWAAAMGTFLTLTLIITFASLASDLMEHHLSFLVFLHYWLWFLPTLLTEMLSIGFVFGSVLALSQAAVSREWVAIRSGGVSLVQWIRAMAFAWGSVLLLTFALQVLIAPIAASKQDRLYCRIKNRPVTTLRAKPWLHMGSTGILWHLDGNTRWGFPLKAPVSGEPALMKWEMPQYKARAVAWQGLNWDEGPEVRRLFPDRALREAENAEEADTLALAKWQQWAPDPQRAFMLWSRLLGWLAGPVLLFSMLPRAFPSPRGGRGTALGIALVVSLLFLGLQQVFRGAAEAGEMPAVWGVLAPLLIMISIGLTSLHRLRT